MKNYIIEARDETERTMINKDKATAQVIIWDLPKDEFSKRRYQKPISFIPKPQPPNGGKKIKVKGTHVQHGIQ